MKINEILFESVNDRIWYHGTTANYDRFSNSYTAGQLGIHLGSNKDQATWRLGDDVGYLLSVKVHDVHNLLRLKDEGSWYGVDFINQLKFNPKTSSVQWRSSMNDRTIRNILIKLGYDGIIYNNKFEGERHAPSIIIFDADKLSIIDRVLVNQGNA